PMGILIGLVTAGVYWWARYSESGQAAVSGLMNFLGSLFETVKTTFGGIIDAIKGGDFALAGSIAMVGLKVAMLQGVAAIAGSVGGAFGDFLGTIGSKIAGGDFAGAWKTAVSAMAAVWDKFSQGVVSAFVSVAKAVVDAWEWAVNRITRLINRANPEFH